MLKREPRQVKGVCTATLRYRDIVPMLRGPDCIYGGLLSFCEALNTLRSVRRVCVHCLHQSLGINKGLSFFPCTPYTTTKYLPSFEHCTLKLGSLCTLRTSGLGYQLGSLLFPCTPYTTIKCLWSFVHCTMCLDSLCTLCTPGFGFQ